MNKLCFRLIALLFVLWMCPINTQAQLTTLEDGAVYHFTNVGDATVSLTVNNIEDVGVAATNTADTKQQWLCKKNGDYYIFCNISNGQFLRGAGTSSDWLLTPSPSTDYNLFELVTAGETNNSIRSKANSNDSYAYMHRTYSNIVGWETTAPTQWTITKIEYNVATLLNSLIPVCESIVNNADDGSYTKIGAYKATVVEDLKSAVADAKVVLTGGVGYSEAYDKLYAEFSNVINAENAAVPFSPSLTYVITNYAYPGETVVAANGYVSSNSNVDKSADAAKWQFKETETAGVYKVYNLSGVYASTIAESSHLATTDEAGAAEYKLIELGNGVWTITLNAEGNRTKFHSSFNRVVGWSADAAATRWYFTPVEVDLSTKTVDELNNLVTKAEKLVDVVAVAKVEELVLQTTNPEESNYLYCNAPYTAEKNSDYSPASQGYNLLDDNTSTFLHTRWSGDSDDKELHYLRVDLGEDNDAVGFSFKYATASRGNADQPRKILVQGSDSEDGEYTTLATLTKDDPNPLPTALNTVAWYNSSLYSNEYRFWRIMVTESGRSNGSYYFFTMAEFDVNTTKLEMRPKYSAVNKELADRLYKEVLKTKYLLSSSPTDEQISAAEEQLSSAYSRLFEEVKTVDDASKNELQALIDKTNSLINEICVGDLDLTTDNLYCNAPYIASNNADNSANYVAKLTDGNNSTYLHTRWNANSDDGEYHYLRVDAGEAGVGDFYFNYVTASRGKKDMPAEIVVEGSNSETGEYTTIETIGSDALPQDLNKNSSYRSDILSTGNSKYRYIRFKVTDIVVEESDGNGHPFFTMSEFGFFSLDVKDMYYEYITKEELVAAVNAVNRAKVMLAANILDGEYEKLLAHYNTLYNAVSRGLSTILPVELTTDATNPIVYNILINRGDGKALQYDGVSTNMVAVADCVNSNQTFGWYFMLGNDNKVKIYPYLGRGKALATDDYSEGNSKVSAVTEGTAGYGYDWSITKITDSDWYNITILNGSTTFYFSNHGGEGNKMGFYNDDTSTDRGSMFKFEKVDYDAISSTETEVEVLKTTGELENSQGNTNNNWKYKWTSNDRLGENPALTIQVGANNMTKTDDDDYLRLYVGSGSTYTLTPAAGYYISSYSFNFVKDGEYEGTVNLVVDGVTYNPTDVEQTITSENTAVYPTGAVSFSMSGVNKGIIVSNFKVILKPMITTHVTYNYYYNSEYVASETLLAGVECKFPAPNAPKGYKNAATPEGKVTELAIKDINCEIWSINIGESLTDVWKKNTWIVLNAEDIPEAITNDVKINGTTSVTSVSYKAGLIDIESSGYLAVNFSTFTKGSNRLEMVGVDLLDSNDNVVAGDYHFGYRGTNKDTNIYSLNVPQAGRYKLRYLVCFQNEADTSDGEIDINLYALQNLTLESHINDNWNTTSWTALNTIPDAITENVKYPDDSTITVANVMEGYVDVPAGLVSVYCVYKSGSQRLDILGVDLLDAYGDVVASDYHFGYAGNSSVNNGYVMSVAKSGIYKLRYIVSFEKSGNTSNGYNRVVAMNPLEEGKLYRIKSVSTQDYCKDKYVHTYCKATDGYDQRHLRFHSDNDISVKPLSIFTFEPVTSLSEYKMKNLHTGMYVKTFLKDNELLGYESAAADVKVTGFAVGQVTLQIDGERPMHAQKDNSIIVDWNADADNASLWSIEEAENSLADYSVTISSVGWSTLCLNYAVKVPEGVTAYVVKSIEANSVTIESIGDVIPAGTPVLLNGAANTYTFKYTTTEDAVSDNKLVGTYYDSYIEADANFTYYILAKYNNAAALCEIKNEFKYNDSGSIEAVGTDEEGTHFKNNANKVYLPVEKSEASGVKAYSLRIIDGATGVEEIVGNIDTGAPEGIYDLSGRRIKEMTSKGIYIVNGKKYIKK